MQALPAPMSPAASALRAEGQTTSIKGDSASASVLNCPKGN
jgi:hypothetical protein